MAEGNVGLVVFRPSSYGLLRHMLELSGHVIPFVPRVLIVLINFSGHRIGVTFWRLCVDSLHVRRQRFSPMFRRSISSVNIRPSLAV